MSTTITNAFVEQYKNNIALLVQQKGSRLRESVVVDSSVVGKNAFYEQLGSTAAVQVTSRHADSPLVNSDHLRRRVSLTDFDWGDLIDDVDKVRTLIDPQSAYAQNAAFAMGRVIDDTIITAASGSADTGVAGGTATVLPAGQKIAVDYVETGSGDSNMTVAKLREAKRILDANEVPDEDRHLALSASCLQALLRNTEVTSADFNVVRALVSGELQQFLGFSFRRTERLAINSDNVRTALAYQRSGIALAVGRDIVTRIEARADKRFSTYVYVSMTIGATRLEEEKVVEILCDEDL